MRAYYFYLLQSNSKIASVVSCNINRVLTTILHISVFVLLAREIFGTYCICHLHVPLVNFWRRHCVVSLIKILYLLLSSDSTQEDPS